MNDETGIKCPVFSPPTGPVHRRQISDFDVICTDPRIPDPYESRLVEVRSSEIEGGNEGLFAKQFLEVNTTISFYNGIRARPEDFNPDTWETNNYKIFDPANMPIGTIDIPEWAQSSAAYHASLAHKTNHSFLPNGLFKYFDRYALSTQRLFHFLKVHFAHCTFRPICCVRPPQIWSHTLYINNCRHRRRGRDSCRIWVRPGRVP